MTVLFDVEPPPLRIGELFAGYGGLGLGVARALERLGFRTERAFVSDIEPGPCAVLAHHWPDVPNVGDITNVDWWTVPRVDVLTGGFPCQDVSTAGRQAGLAPGTRSGLWSEFARAIAVLRPGLVVIENVRGLLSARASKGTADADDMEPCPICLDYGDGGDLRALGAVLGDLADIGFDAEWGMLAAADVGAAHRRERVFIIAWPAADADGVGDERQRVVRELRRATRASQGEGDQRERGGRAVDDRGEAVRLMPTPDTSLGTRGGAQAPDKRCEGGHAVSLADVAHVLLPTPRAAAGMGSPLRPHAVNTSRLEDAVAVRLIPTPMARDAEGSGSSTPHSVTLTDAAIGRRGLVHGAAPALMPTPTTEPMTGNGHAPHLGAETQRFGDHADAVERWTGIVGRPAPDPVEPGSRGGVRLAAPFVEWLMGLPVGHVTGVGLSRRYELRLLGNGVVPQQADAAVSWLLVRAFGVAA